MLYCLECHVLGRSGRRVLHLKALTTDVGHLSSAYLSTLFSDVDNVTDADVGQRCLEFDVIDLILWEGDNILAKAGDAISEVAHVYHHVIDRYKHGLQHRCILKEVEKFFLDPRVVRTKQRIHGGTHGLSIFRKR